MNFRTAFVFIGVSARDEVGKVGEAGVRCQTVGGSIDLSPVDRKTMA